MEPIRSRPHAIGNTRRAASLLRPRVIIGVLGALLWALAPAQPAGAATAPSASDWPTCLHDPSRTAASADATLSPTNAAGLTRAWSYSTGGVVAASSAIVGRTVYVGSWDGYEYANGKSCQT